MAGWSAELELVAGAGGEPVDLWRTLQSHGVADLPPNSIDVDARVLETTLALPRGRARTIRIRAGRPGFALVESARLGARDALVVTEVTRRILRLDADLSPFYEAARDDPDLAWACAGAGRMLRSPTVYEDVVKTICTTNCAWSATVRMVTALVSKLGLEAPDGRRAFPDSRGDGEAQRRRSTRTSSARATAAPTCARSRPTSPRGASTWRHSTTRSCPTKRWPRGCSPSPAAGRTRPPHMMMLLGRYSRLILDSWTRPKYARLRRRKATDAAIERRFRRYGPYAGLAFWLYLTRDWVADPA